MSSAPPQAHTEWTEIDTLLAELDAVFVGLLAVSILADGVTNCTTDPPNPINACVRECVY